MKTAIILAGGIGTRAGGGLPKQLHQLHGHPIFSYSMRAFLDADPNTLLVLVVHPLHLKAFMPEVKAISTEYGCDILIAEGGKSRPESVMNALQIIPKERSGFVAVHDAARPLVSPALISNGWRCAAVHLAVVPAIPITDTIRHLDSDFTDKGSHTVPRSEYVAVQTPQIFSLPLLREAYNRLTSSDIATVTDDASVMELSGHSITLYPGDYRNMKITTPSDFIIAESLLP